MNYKKVIIAGIVAGVVSFIYRSLTCGWLFSGVYQIEPANIWKISADFSSGQMLMSTLGTIVLSIILAGVYAYIQKGIPCRGIKKGLCYGLIVWLVGTLPGMFATYMFMTVATTVVVYWILTGLVNYLLLGLVIAKIYKE